MDRRVKWLAMLVLVVEVAACQPSLPADWLATGEPTRTASPAPTNTQMVTLAPQSTDIPPIPTQTPYPSQTPPPTQVEAFSTPLALTGTPAPQPRIPLSPENITSAVELIRFGDGQVNDVAYSPDGSQIAVATSLGVQLYNAQTLMVVDSLETAMLVRRVIFAPDSQRLALEFNDFVMLWTPDSGTLERVFEGRITDMVFRSDGTLVMVDLVRDDDTYYLQTWHDGLLQHRIPCDTPWQVVLLPDGERVFIFQHQDIIGRVVQLDGGELVAQIRRASECGYADAGFTFSSDMQVMATGCQAAGVQYEFSGYLLIWQVSDGELLHAIDNSAGSLGSLWGVEFSPDGTLVAGIAWGIIKVWRVADGELVATLGGDSRSNSDEFSELAFSPDNRILLLGGRSGEVLAWRLSDGALVKQLKDPVPDGSQALLSPDGQMAITSSWDAVQIWDTSSGELLRTLDAMRGREIPRRNRATAMGEASLDSLSGPRIVFTDIACSPDGRFLVTVNSASGLMVWDTADWKPVLYYDAILTGHSGPMGFSPDGRVFVYFEPASVTRVLHWDTNDWTAAPEITTLEVDTEFVFAADGQLWLINNTEGDFSVTRWGDEAAISNFTLDVYFWDAVLSPDDSLLVVTDRIMGVIDLNTGEVTQPFDSALYVLGAGGYVPDRIGGTSFSPGGQLLALASDKYIQILDVADWHTLALLAGHNDAVYSVMFSTDGTQLLSAGADGTARLWGVLP